MNTWMMSVTGAVTAFVAGIVVGALLWQWRTSVQTRRAMHKRGKPFLLWDVHSVLNAMNKLALTAERGRPVEPSLIYLLSDYLLHSALIQREDGWADRHSLENWLMAHVRVIADHRGQTTLPAVTVQMPEDLRRIQTTQILRQLLWFLHKTTSVTRIHVQVQTAAKEASLVKVRVEIDGERTELSSPSEEASSSWQVAPGMSSIEMRTPYEAGPA